MQDLNEVRRLRYELNATAVKLIFSELSLGLTLCKIAKERPIEGPRRSLRAARRAHGIARKQMFQMRMGHPEFDRMTAQAELLCFELDTQGY